MALIPAMGVTAEPDVTGMDGMPGFARLTEPGGVDVTGVTGDTIGVEEPIEVVVEPSGVVSDGVVVEIKGEAGLRIGVVDVMGVVRLVIGAVGLNSAGEPAG